MKEYKNFDKEVNDLLKSMSIREKVGQCVMIEPVFCLESLNKKHGNVFKSIEDPNFLKIILDDYKIGFLLYGGITRIGDDSLLDWGTYINNVNKYVNSNNHIPLFYGVDAVHGLNFVKNTAIFSHNLGAISSWNRDLVKDYMKVVNKELHSIGINMNFAPTIDIARDQRWGRVYESLGEDPYLASEMSKMMIEGLQDDDRVAACGKHYVGYGAANNGMDRTPADISERELKEVHLRPFIKAIESGVKSIMVNGADLNGVPLPASKIMLNDVLKEELGFKGFTLSDWEDVSRLVERHKVVRNKEDAILRSFNAGLDMNMAVSDLETVDIMEKLVKEGKITESRLNQAVTSILRTKFELGLFNRLPIDLESIKARPYLNESKEVAKKIVEESITLLKNDDVLPLRKDIKRILVTGKGANSKRHMCGGWTLNWASANEEDLNFPTILDELKNKVSPDCVITHVENEEELNKLYLNENSFDVIISVVTEEPHSEWLGDSFDLYIEQEELDLLKAAHRTGIDVVMVSLLGRPQKLKWQSKNIPAILWAYYPGSEGAKPLVDILFGDINPSGKTPMTFPVNANQIPIVYNARRYDSYEITTKYEPLYPFGFGLSYTTFEYSNINSVKEINLGEDLEVKVTVKNTGNKEGTEIVQLYLVDLFASVTRPLKSLKGFTRVSLKPNESKEVALVLTKDELSIHNEYLDFVEEARDIEIHIGDQNCVVSIKE